jgi:hypothetical protein
MAPDMPPMMDVQNMPMNSVDQQIMQQQPFQEPSSSRDGSGDFAQLSSMISDLDRRLRILEERYGNLRKKLQITDESVLDSERTFNKELHSMNDDTMTVKKQVHEFSEKLNMFGMELENVAQKKDLKVIEKYMLMWSPTNYVSRKELKEYLKGQESLQDSDEETTEEEKN